MRHWWYASKITPPSFVSQNHLLVWLRAALSPISPDGINFHVHLCECFPKPLEGGWDCLMSHSCLESQGCHLIPFSDLLSSSSTYSSCSVFLSCNFCNNFPFSLLFSKIFSNICVWDRPFCLPVVFAPCFRKSLMYFLKVFIKWTFVIRVSWAGWKHAVLPTDVYVHKWVYFKLHFSLKRSTFMLEILLDFEDYASSYDLCNS